MRHRRVLVALIAGIVLALPAPLSAQQSRPAPKANQPPPDSDVEELTPGQIRRAQELQRQQDLQRAQEQLRIQERQRAQEQQRAQDQEPPAPKSAAPKAPPASAPATPARAVACAGPFAKESSHLKLATVFNSQNITFTEVDGPAGAKIKATVLFPKDAKKRLEVWWQNEASRSVTYLIVINGQSTWTAPKGLRLGLGLAAVEKLNGKPFKLKGFDKDGGDTTDWQDGGLASLPGGCRVGLKFAPDPKAPEAARTETMVGNEFDSSDAAMRAARPTISEIILGY